VPATAPMAGTRQGSVGFTRVERIIHFIYSHHGIISILIFFAVIHFIRSDIRRHYSILTFFSAILDASLIGKQGGHNGRRVH